MWENCHDKEAYDQAVENYKDFHKIEPKLTLLESLYHRC